MSPCWTRWRVGTWLMNFYDSVMSTKQNKSNTDGTLKRVHTDVSDFSSSDEESRKSSNSVKKCKVNSSKNWSRFLVISSIEDGALTKLSPFAIQKAIVNENVPQSIVTLNTNLQAVAVKVTAHKTITLCSVYLPPRNHFNFNPKECH